MFLIVVKPFGGYKYGCCEYGNVIDMHDEIHALMPFGFPMIVLDNLEKLHLLGIKKEEIKFLDGFTIGNMRYGLYGQLLCP